MWFAPRTTIRALLDAERRREWIPVVALTATQQALVWGKSHATENTVATTILLALFFGGLQLVYSILVGPFLLAIVGGWLGGDADPEDLREAVAWGLVPQAAAIVLWIPLVAAYGSSAFGPAVPPANGLQLAALLLLLLVPVAAFWSMVLQIGGIAAAQRFSIGRALLTQIILTGPLLLLIALTR